jgi:hypothetical protein
VSLEQGLALGVVLPRELVVVPHAAVRLDDQVPIRPPEVGDDATAGDLEGLVDVRVRKTAPEHQVQDHILELAPGRRGAGRNDAPKARDAATRSRPLEYVDKLPDTHPLYCLCSANGCP